MSQSDTRAVFGLGENVSNLRLEIKWVSGQTEIFDQLKDGKYYTIQPGNIKLSAQNKNEI